MCAKNCKNTFIFVKASQRKLLVLCSRHGVYSTCVLAVLICGWETWTLTQPDKYDWTAIGLLSLCHFSLINDGTITSPMMKS